MRSTKPDLTEHEQVIQELLMDLSHLASFPDNDRKLDNVTRLYARFASTEPYRLQEPPALKGHLSQPEMDEILKPSRWKDGVVPAEWLMAKIGDTCKFFPAPIDARKIYCKAGFRPLDGQDGEAIAEDTRREGAGE